VHLQSCTAGAASVPPGPSCLQGGVCVGVRGVGLVGLWGTRGGETDGSRILLFYTLGYNHTRNYHATRPAACAL
jgi:hypothetical protein